MKKWLSVACMAGFLFAWAGTAWAQPEPIRQVEVFRKPGIDFRLFKFIGDEISVNIQPAATWSIDKSDPFLKARIQELSLKAAKQEGWVPISTVDADVKVAIRVYEWGRLQNSHDQNLMEFLTIEVNAYSVSSGAMIFRASGKYSRVDPLETTTDKVNEAYVSILAEILTALRTNG